MTPSKRGMSWHLMILTGYLNPVRVPVCYRRRIEPNRRSVKRSNNRAVVLGSVALRQEARHTVNGLIIRVLSMQAKNTVAGFLMRRRHTFGKTRPR
jgi:hypothetical protein